MTQKSKITSVADPIIGGVLILGAAQALTLYVASQEKIFVEANKITSPGVGLEVPLIYFFGAVGVMALLMFLVPVSKLKIIMKVMFVLLLAWGVFIGLSFLIDFPAALAISVAAALWWVYRPMVWLHNLVLGLTLVSIGAVFGFVIEPWTAMILMLVISVYDVVAVRFGFMVWMAKRMTESDTLPAFVIPRDLSNWKLNLKKAGFREVFEGESGQREFSILGGGDVGFPLFLAVSVFFMYGLAQSVLVAVFSVLGLVAAYLIQLFFLKGKPMPALPPISILSLAGLLLALRI